MSPSNSKERATRVPHDVWDVAARRLIKGAMQTHGYSCKSLAYALEVAGEEVITETALRTRINRGVFGMGFALCVLRVIGVTNLDVSHLKLEKATKRR